VYVANTGANDVTACAIDETTADQAISLAKAKLRRVRVEIGGRDGNSSLAPEVRIDLMLILAPS